jgi:hypothetical protein
VRVTELVPQVTRIDGGSIRAREVALTVTFFHESRDAARGLNRLLEHRQVRRAWLVQAGDERVDRTEWTVACDDEIRPALPGRRSTPAVRH